MASSGGHVPLRPPLGSGTDEARSRRNNLIFWGLSENYGENCFAIIREHISHHLGLDAGNMYLARAHRLGQRKIGIRNPKRPIIVNFRDFCDTDMIMSKANMLKGTPFSICYDLPKEINEARKKLWDEVKSIKSKRPSARVQIVYPAKLVVEGKIVRDEFPDWGDIIQASRLPEFTYIENVLPMWNVCDTIDTDDNCQQSSSTRDSILPTSTMNNNCNPTNGNATVSTRDSYMNDQHSMNGNSSTQRPTHNECINVPVTEIEMQEMQHMHDKSDSSTRSDSQDRSQSLFRPYVGNVANSVPNSRNSSYDIMERNNLPDKQCERASRSVQRGLRRTQSKSIPRANQATGDKENPNSINSKPGPSTETPTHTESRDSATMENHDGSKNKQSESPSRNVTDNTHING